MIKAKIDVRKWGSRKGKIVLDGQSDDIIREIGWVLKAFWETVPAGMEIQMRAKLMNEIKYRLRRDD